MEILLQQECESEGPTPTTAPQPIFILGIAPRSGTHFLANLLCLHPGCTKSAIPEDALLSEAALLDRYSRALEKRWAQQAGMDHHALRELLIENLGSGLISFLQQARTRVLEDNAKRFGNSLTGLDRRIVTKTPGVPGLQQCFRLFPSAQLLILVRDGRAVVESCVQSFKQEPERAMRDWAQAAQKILQFDRDPNNKGRAYLLIRYEDLVQDVESETSRILCFLGLDIERYDFEAARHLPVVGSSSFKRGAGPVHWLPVCKTAEFKPLERAGHWDRSQHERFNWICKEYLEAFGYGSKEYDNNRLLWTLWNRAKDLKWQLNRTKTNLKSRI